MSQLKEQKTEKASEIDSPSSSDIESIAEEYELDEEQAVQLQIIFALIDDDIITIADILSEQAINVNFTVPNKLAKIEYGQVQLAHEQSPLFYVNSVTALKILVEKSEKPVNLDRNHH
jgi:hypothetical protein